MSVLMPNAKLGLRRRADLEARNAHGERVPAGYGPVVADGLFDGLIEEGADGSWTLGLDPALWPVRMGDMVVSGTGQTWSVTTSDLIENSFDDLVSWVRTTAQRISEGGGTEPGGPWFVARFLDTTDPEVPDANGVPVLRQPGVWTGGGPPPTTDFGAKAGDEYIDLISGTVYRLR